jgi:hypothetical protein
VGLEVSHVLTIECDNDRAIGLITADDASFDTKLRHVDIHYLWLRQEVKAGRVALRWVPTAKMVADGLTKVLSRQKHASFVKLLRMVEIGRPGHEEMTQIGADSLINGIASGSGWGTVDIT